MKPHFAVYIHIPFCFHKCPYCDFNTYAVANLPEKEYIQALLAELDYMTTREEWHGREIKTVYFGGGTPSLLAAGSIKRLLSSLMKSFPVAADAEVSLEANPGTVTIENLRGYREAGVNRLSLGAQSFNIETLKKLGRMHTPEQVGAAFEAARAAGFNNINLDLIYGVEGQELSGLRRDLEAILTLKPEHISAYGLTIEKGTPFYTTYKKGKMKLPDEELIVQMMREIRDTLKGNSYEHYEISNFCRSGREARHNLAYWNGEDYLGLGAGAHSYSSPKRWSNYALPIKYMQHASATGSALSWSDTLTLESLIFEFFFLGLRKLGGVSRKDFYNRFNMHIDQIFPITLHILTEHGKLFSQGDIIRLSEEGILVADSVVESFAEIEHPDKAPSRHKVAGLTEISQ